MPTRHEVTQGECMLSIASRHGFSDWASIYDHPDNAALKKRRSSPSALAPGDVVIVPDLKKKQADCPPNKVSSFTVKRAKWVLRVVVKGHDDKPLGSKKYLLRLGDRSLRGTTGGDGLVEQPLQIDDQRGELTVWMTSDEKGPSLHWDLLLGHLDPIEEVRGVQGRLHNLGFFCGEVDGVVGPRTRAALKAFQIAVKLKATGEIDDATRDKLRGAHGKI